MKAFSCVAYKLTLKVISRNWNVCESQNIVEISILVFCFIIVVYG